LFFFLSLCILNINDEVLAVGDAAFQDKCINKINQVANEGRIILFVSYSDGALHRICWTGLYLEHGQLKNFGDMKDVLGQYQVDYGKKNEIAICFRQTS